MLSYQAQQDGIVAFTVDGYEGLTTETFTESAFDKTKYEVSSLSDETKVKAGDPVYRMITSEDWSVIVPLSKETAIKLKHEDVSGIKVRMDKDAKLFGENLLLSNGKENITVSLILIIQ